MKIGDCKYPLAPFAVVLVLGVVGCAKDRATSRESAGHLPAASTRAAAVDVAGVDNFGFVSQDVLRGAKPTRTGFRSLEAMGVRTVIDLQEADESADVPAGIAYVPIRTSAWRADTVDTSAVVEAIRASRKPVFIHCLQGRDRTGLAVAAYRKSQGAGCDEVIAELRAFHVNLWWRGPIERKIRDLYRADAGS